MTSSGLPEIPALGSARYCFLGPGPVSGVGTNVHQALARGDLEAKLPVSHKTGRSEIVAAGWEARNTSI